MGSGVRDSSHALARARRYRSHGARRSSSLKRWEDVWLCSLSANAGVGLATPRVNFLRCELALLGVQLSSRRFFRLYTTSYSAACLGLVRASALCHQSVAMSRTQAGHFTASNDCRVLAIGCARRAVHVPMGCTASLRRRCQCASLLF